MLSFACLAITLLPAPARAGHWVWTVSGSGQASTNTGRLQTWTAPTEPVTLPISIPQIAAGDAAGRQFGYGPYPSITANASLSVTVTGTWTTDANSDNTAPPGILFSVTSQAQSNEQNNGAPLQPGTSANDGYGDPVAQTGSSSVIGTSQTPGTKYVPSQNGSCTLSLSLSASASGTPGTAGGGSAEANVGSVTIGIHAQPYNFRRVPGQGKIGIDGNIDWVYNYSSTDGNPNDLTTCTWHEHLTYPGGSIGTQAAPNKYYPPSPPFGYPASGTAWFPNPDFGTDVSLVPSPAGSSPEVDDITYVPAFLKPYTGGTFNTTQVFEFNDSATGDKNVQIPGPDSGPFTIVRTVKYVDPTHYEYDVSKAGVPDTLSLTD